MHFSSFLQAAASLLDRRLQTFIVPRTEVVSISSPTFFYSWLDLRKPELPSKPGSFQLFCHGFEGQIRLLCSIILLIIADLTPPYVVQIPFFFFRCFDFSQETSLARLSYARRPFPKHPKKAPQVQLVSLALRAQKKSGRGFR
jgi:hypothetical protein